ncbi:uncharacterized protein LOC120348196 [Styela clava]
MVSQSVVIEDKQKEVFSDVELPLPGENITENDDNVPDTMAEKSNGGLKRVFWDTLGPAFILALIIVVAILSVRIYEMDKVIDAIKHPNEIELKPRKMIDHDKTIDLTADLDNDAHEKLRRMEKEYGREDWKSHCRTYIRFEKPSFRYDRNDFKERY